MNEQNSKRYYLVVWHHNFKNEPQLIVHEVDSDDKVTRMLERYSDGRIDKRCRKAEGLASLVDQPFSDAQLSALSEEFTCFEINSQAFIDIWHSDRIGENGYITS